MKKILLALLLSALSLTSLTSCNSINKNTHNFNLNDSGTEVNLQKGVNFSILLEANATTGYQWEITKYNKAIIKLVKSDYKVESNLMGAGGIQQYIFKVIGIGKTELKIIYHRPWEKDVKPTETFKLKIIAD